ncbi:MAG: ABC transporter permease [Planctomycetaceae bacterium]|nr:ABC transporter permease [Planctomycetaceae bacterium]
MHIFLHNIRALVTKEFLAVLRDPKSRIVLIVPPIVQLLVFGYAITFDLNRVPLAVYDENPSQASRELIALFTGSPNFHKVASIDRQEQIAELIDRKDALMVVHIGSSFTRDLLLSKPASVQIILDGRNSNTALIALNYAQSIVSRFNDAWRQTHQLAGPPARLETRAWFNPNLESRWFMIPGIAGLLTLVVTMTVTALSVAREREQGTFDQLLMTPLRPVEILLGKTLPGFIIGLIEGTFIFAVTVLWFKIPLRGHLLTLYTGLSLFLLSSVGVGLMISSLSATMQQGLLGAFLFLVPAITLSGFTTPIVNMPVWLQYLTLLNPMRYFMVVIRSTFLEGAAFGSLVHQFWPMGVIGLVCMSAAGWLFRNRLY